MTMTLQVCLQTTFLISFDFVRHLDIQEPSIHVRVLLSDPPSSLLLRCTDFVFVTFLDALKKGAVALFPPSRRVIEVRVVA